jgi:hypothetical protein
MPRGESSRRNALVMSIGWWYLRRMIRKRGTAAVAGFVAGEGLSLVRPRKRHALRWILALAAVAVGVLLWFRRRGGGDDWGDWEPVVPDSPLPAEPAPAPAPAPEPEPVAT